MKLWTTALMLSTLCCFLGAARADPALEARTLGTFLESTDGDVLIAWEVPKDYPPAHLDALRRTAHKGTPTEPGQLGLVQGKFLLRYLLKDRCAVEDGSFTPGTRITLVLDRKTQRVTAVAKTR